MRKTVAIFFAFCGLSFAHTFSGTLNPFPGKISRSQLAPVKILAVMADFQTDRDENTYGNGKFGSIYSQNYGSGILDPLPHDKPYFEAHLKFVKNYFEKLSKGRQSIEYDVMPGVFTVSKTMRNYSPDSKSKDLTPLAEFAGEVWNAVGSANPSLDFSRYDLFIIFHAGCGRDVSIPGSLGIERDLPSIYLGEKALKTVYGNDFQGFAPSPAAGRIQNSLIIPETESRELDGTQGKYLLKLSINGLLCASLGSHLGLPDLYDTETGKTAIGRFGLMDGQSMFAYSGCFPPEPSAWEKLRLGWDCAKDAPFSGGHFNISSFANASAADTTILRVFINPSEYYLIENKQRDANSDGCRIKLYGSGAETVRIFPRDTTGFDASDIDSLSGVVTDLDEYNWALPGSGLAIWHVDDSIIASKIDSDRINADSRHRGIYLEEADGVFDIGEEFTDLLGNNLVSEGTGYDLWYRGNKSRYYKNIFSSASKPSTLSNSSAASLIGFRNFSVSGNKMDFDLYQESDLLSLRLRAVSAEKSAPRYLAALIENDSLFYFEVYNNTIYKLNSKGSILASYRMDSGIEGFACSFRENNEYILTSGGKEFNYFINGISHSGRLESAITAPPVIADSIAVLATASGGIFRLGMPSGIVSALPYSFDKARISRLITDGSGNLLYAAYGSSIFCALKNQRVSFPAEIYCSVPVSFGNKTAGLIIRTSENKFYVIKEGALENSFQGLGQGLNPAQRDFIPALLPGGGLSVVYASGSSLYAQNLTGALVDNFPLTLADGDSTGTIMSADINKDGTSEILFSSTGGQLRAISSSGKDVPGFPVSAPKSAKCAVFSAEGRQCIISDSGLMYIWETGAESSSVPAWPSQYGGNENRGIFQLPEAVPQSSEFFPKGRAYNWPNPAYGPETFIRYYVSEDATVKIRIFDLAGDRVAELSGNAIGGHDNETVWNLGGIQSGIYFANLEVRSNSGKTEQKIIKIAVVK